MVSIPVLMNRSRSYGVVLARSAFLPRQHLLIDARNHRLSISYHRLSVPDFRLDVHNHRLGAHNHRFGIRDRRVGVDCQLGLKEVR